MNQGSALTGNTNRAGQCTSHRKNETTFKQQDDESLTEWNKCFKQEYDIFKQLMGKEFLNDFIHKSKWYRDESETTKKDQIKMELLVRS